MRSSVRYILLFSKSAFCHVYKSHAYQEYDFVCWQWKFAFLLMGRSEYLQESDVLSARFQVDGGA